MRTRSSGKLEGPGSLILPQRTTRRKRRESLSSRKTPINGVPPEILAYILKAILEDVVGHLGFPGRGLDGVPQWWSSRRWAQLAEVCRYWRATFLSDPSLWSTIIIDKSTRYRGKRHQNNVVQTYLANSGELPLRVYAYNPFSLAPVAQHCGRLLDLRVQFTQPEVESVMSVFTSPAPVLETLEVRYHDAKVGSGEGPSHYAPVHLPRLFRNQTPSLRRLSLQRTFSSDVNLFTDLTHVVIRGRGDGVSFSKRDMLLILSLLKRSPHLQEMNIVSPKWIPNDVSVNIATNELERLSLPALQRLSLKRFPFSESAYFLDRVEIPVGCDLAISEVAGTYSGLFDALPQNTLRIGTVQNFTSLALLQKDWSFAWVVAIGPSGSLRISLSDLYWQMKPHEEDMKHTPFYWIQPLFHRQCFDGWNFPLIHLKELYITGPTSLPRTNAQVWASILRPLSSLELLVVRCRDSNEVFSALGSQDTTMTASPVICPNLKLLHICDPRAPIAWTVALTCLNFRKAQGYQLRIKLWHISSEGYSITGSKPAHPDLEELNGCSCPEILIPDEARLDRHQYWDEWPPFEPELDDEDLEGEDEGFDD
ncbi:hypothetical protein EIP91_004290 [Steccherinum ochraceum]|uniref:Uncharacterized protein n=1 Tax=Steccherinum ochraceum TaxID=92696 RepID=A0A4R0RA18_9APHY|nr:hypothetical protein EIP91_004290 [Steccherinum ochraceum]